MGQTLTFNQWISVNESWNLLFESTSDDIRKAVDTARSSDSEKVKSAKGYDSIMSWFENGGPEKGKATIDDDSMLKSMTYWNGDLSSKVSNKGKRASEAMELLTDEGNVSKLMKRLQKASGSSVYLTYDVKLIVDAATKLKAKFDELTKDGKEVSQKSPDGFRYDVQTTLSPDKYPGRLGIIPWTISTESGLDEYNGKDIGSGNAKQFTKWYKKIKEEGVDNLISMLDEEEYIRPKAIGMDDDFKIQIINKLYDKSVSSKKNISDALSIKFYPTSATSEVRKDIQQIEKEPTEEFAEFKFPMDQTIAKTFFLDDQAVIDPKFANSISEFVSNIKTQLPDGAEVTKVTIKAVASTSTVPSTKYAKVGGNEALVDKRLEAIEKKTFDALSANKLANNVGYDKKGRLPNNGPAYDRNKYGLDKRKADPAVRAEYEKIYGEFRFSGVQILIGYKLTTPNVDDQITIDIQTDGDWKAYISWSKPGKTRTSSWKPGKLKFRKSGGGLYPTKPGTGCANFCAAYG